MVDVLGTDSSPCRCKKIQSIIAGNSRARIVVAVITMKLANAIASFHVWILSSLFVIHETFGSVGYKSNGLALRKTVRCVLGDRCNSVDLPVASHGLDLFDLRAYCGPEFGSWCQGFVDACSDFFKDLTVSIASPHSRQRWLLSPFLCPSLCKPSFSLI